MRRDAHLLIRCRTRSNGDSVGVSSSVPTDQTVVLTPSLSLVRLLLFFRSFLPSLLLRLVGVDLRSGTQTDRQAGGQPGCGPREACARADQHALFRPNSQ